MNYFKKGIILFLFMSSFIYGESLYTTIKSYYSNSSSKETGLYLELEYYDYKLGGKFFYNFDKEKYNFEKFNLQLKKIDINYEKKLLKNKNYKQNYNISYYLLNTKNMLVENDCPNNAQENFTKDYLPFINISLGIGGSSQKIYGTKKEYINLKSKLEFSLGILPLAPFFMDHTDEEIDKSLAIVLGLITLPSLVNYTFENTLIPDLDKFEKKIKISTPDIPVFISENFCMFIGYNYEYFKTYYKVNDKKKSEKQKTHDFYFGITF